MKDEEGRIPPSSFVASGGPSSRCLLDSSSILTKAMSDLLELERRALAELDACADEPALRAWNTRYFGKQGEVQGALKGIGGVPKEQRAAYGQQANQVRVKLTAAYEAALARVQDAALEL